MIGEYKRETKIIDLPSGKKVEIITFFSQEEISDIRASMIKGQKVSGSKLIDMDESKDTSKLFEGMEFDLEALNNASKLTKEIALMKLIEGDKEYAPTKESIRNFFNEEDGEALDEILNAMNKKKLKKKS